MHCGCVQWERQYHERFDLQQQRVLLGHDDHRMQRRHVLQWRLLRFSGSQRRALPDCRAMPERKLHGRHLLRRRSNGLQWRLQESGGGLGKLRRLWQTVFWEQLR